MSAWESTSSGLWLPLMKHGNAVLFLCRPPVDSDKQLAVLRCKWPGRFSLTEGCPRRRFCEGVLSVCFFRHLSSQSPAPLSRPKGG